MEPNLSLNRRMMRLSLLSTLRVVSIEQRELIDKMVHT